MTDRFSAERTAGRWLHITGTTGLLLSVVFFLLYVLGIPAGRISPEEAAAGWHRSSSEYLDAYDMDPEAGWMFFYPDDGYALSTAATALLASAALPTLLALASAWFRRKNWLYAGMAVCISAVLAVAILR